MLVGLYPINVRTAEPVEAKTFEIARPQGRFIIGRS